MTPTLRELTETSARVGVLSFGGPAAQIALMHRVYVDEKKWLEEREYTDALGFCMLLPGPEAMQLATYVGWRLHRLKGGLVAGGLFVLPGAIVVLALSILYAYGGDLGVVENAFVGIKAAVFAVVIEALLRVSKRALRGRVDYVIAALAFVAIFFLDLPFPAIIAVAALTGTLLRAGTGATADLRPRATASASLASTLRTAGGWLAVWWLPVLAIWAIAGQGFLLSVATFFSKLAVFTFGGAYSVLSWMAQDVVTEKGWLTPGQMIDGLGLAETTPGPLILVTEFVGFTGGFERDGILLALGAAAVTLWVTFVPCFLWIFAGAPHLDRIVRRPRLRGALAAVTAAVVGVILNLTVWFGLHALFANVRREEHGPLVLWRPELASVSPAAVAIAVLAAVLLLRLHQPLWRVLVLAAALGVAAGALGVS